MDLHVTVPDWAFTVLYIVVGVIIYSFIGALTGAILSRFDFDGKQAPPHEIAGFLWPITLIIALIVLAFFILWWSIFLPARGIYWLLAKKT